MNKILKLTVILLLIIFYSCNKDDVTELTKEEQANDQLSKFEKNSQECDYEENVFDAFCYDPSPPDYVVVKNLTDDLPDNYVSFEGDEILETEIAKMTPLVYERGEPTWIMIRKGQQNTYVFPFLEGESKQATFYVSTLKEHYVLTASEHWYIKKVQQGKADGNLMNQIKNAMPDASIIGDPDIYALVTPCDNFKVRAIDKYIKTWGIEEYLGNDVIRGIIADAFVEQGVDLDDVGIGRNCDDFCVDPIQVTQTLLTFTQFQFPEIAEIVKQNTLASMVDLSTEELEELMSFDATTNETLIDILWNTILNDGVCEGGQLVDATTNSITNDGFSDACDSNISSDEMVINITSALGDNGDLSDFYDDMGESYEYIQVVNFEHCPRMKCVLEKLLEMGLCSEIADNFEELEGAFDLIFQYDFNCMSHGNFSQFLNYGPDCSFITGEQHPNNSFYVRTFAKGNCFETDFNSGVYECNPFSLQLYNQHFCNDLSPIEMASFMLHESLHSEFHNWIYDAIGNNVDLLSGEFVFTAVTPLWSAIVEMKYGSDSITNHHKLMNEYFVPQIAETLWALNGETDSTTIENYYYFAYDLFTPDDQMLVDSMFITQQELDYYIGLSNGVISNTGCE